MSDTDPRQTAAEYFQKGYEQQMAGEYRQAIDLYTQFIKGGFSHRFTKETGSIMEIWQRTFTNHRIRDWTDFERHKRYIHLNPVRAGLVEFPRDYPYSSAHSGFVIDEAPQRLEPSLDALIGTAGSRALSHRRGRPWRSS